MPGTGEPLPKDTVKILLNKMPKPDYLDIFVYSDIDGRISAINKKIKASAGPNSTTSSYSFSRTNNPEKEYVSGLVDEFYEGNKMPIAERSIKDINIVWTTLCAATLSMYNFNLKSEKVLVWLDEALRGVEKFSYEINIPSTLDGMNA